MNNVFPSIHTWWENSSYWFFLVWCWPPTKMGLGAVSLFRKGWFAHQRRCTNPELFCHHFSLLLEGKKMLLEVKCCRLSNKQHCVLISLGISSVTNKQANIQTSKDFRKFACACKWCVLIFWLYPCWPKYATYETDQGLKWELVSSTVQCTAVEISFSHLMAPEAPTPVHYWCVKTSIQLGLMKSWKYQRVKNSNCANNVWVAETLPTPAVYSYCAW